METTDAGIPPNKKDLEFIKFFNHMARYDRIKQVRKRQNQRSSVQNSTQSNRQSQLSRQGRQRSSLTQNIQQKPKNPYLGSLIPF
jgi:hypothetical protein